MVHTWSFQYMSLSAGLHQCHAINSCSVNNGWTFSGQASYVMSIYIHIYMWYIYIHLAFTLSIHAAVDTSVVFIVWLLWIAAVKGVQMSLCYHLLGFATILSMLLGLWPTETFTADFYRTLVPRVVTRKRESWYKNLGNSHVSYGNS